MINGKSKKGITLAQKQSIAGYLFTLPFVIGYIVFMLSPFIFYIIMGLSNQSLTNEGGIVFDFVGLSNFKEAILVQTGFMKSIFDSLLDMIITFPAILLYSFFIAIILNQKFKGRTIARAIFFLPVLLCSGVALLVQNDILTTMGVNAVIGNQDKSDDALNLTKTLLDLFGTNANTGIISLVSALVSKIYSITMLSGVQILIFLAGIQTISPSLYEASSMEGATAWENFWKITFPIMSPIILVNCIYTIIVVLGSENNRVINNLYDLSMSQFKYGLSSAMGLVYFLIIFLVLGIVIFFVSKIVFYEER